MCWGLGRAPLSPPGWGGLGCGGGEPEAAEGPGSCGGVVPLKASPQQQPSLPLLLPVSCREGPSLLCARPRWHHLQPDPAAAAAGRQRPVQLPAAPAGPARQQHPSRETSGPCFCARWVTAGPDGQVPSTNPLLCHANCCSAMCFLFLTSGHFRMLAF